MNPEYSDFEVNLTATDQNFNEAGSDVLDEKILWDTNEESALSTSEEDGFPFTKYAIGVILVIIIILSIAGNLLVCLAIYTDRRLRKLGNLFLASLALADLFVASLVMTFAVANDLMGYWMFGQQFCEVWIASDIMLTTCSILNLSAIAIDR